MSCDQSECRGQLLLATGTVPRTQPLVGDGPDGLIGARGRADRVELLRTAAATVQERTVRGEPVARPEGEASRDDNHGQPETEDTVLPGTRRVLIAFAVFTLLAVNQLLVLGGHTDQFFAWPISSRPNATFLGAAYGAGSVLSVLALRQRQWSSVRVAVVTVTAFTVLTLIPTLLHMHRLQLTTDAVIARSAAWVWLTVYLLVPVACLVVVVGQERRRSRPERVVEPMPVWLAGILLVQGAALATAGALLWIEGAGVHVMTEVMRPPWPWPVTPLTSQVLGAWLLSFGFAIGLAIREWDLTRMLVPAVAYAAFGLFELLVLLTYRTAPGTDSRWLLIDVAVLATLVPTGAYGWWSSRRATRRLPVVDRPQERAMRLVEQAGDKAS